MNGICVIQNQNNISGTIEFHQCNKDSPTQVLVKLKGFKPNKTHAIHIHEFGDLSKGCESLGPHFNPLKKNHGNYKVHGFNRHAGDLMNNITTDGEGNVKVLFEDHLISLYKFSPMYIIGRSVVIHDKPDDLGLGETQESITTGSAGARIACGVIGLTKEKHLF